MALTAPRITDTGRDTVLENALIRVCFGDDGSIVSIYDKEAEREVLAGGANRLLLWEDKPYAWDAWDISRYYRETKPEAAALLSRKSIYQGVNTAKLRQNLSIGNSSIQQDIILVRDSKLLRFDMVVDWQESQKLLKVEAKTVLRAPHATHCIQFGSIERVTHANTSWDDAMFEVPAQRCADLSQPDYGLALMSDCKYGFYIKDSVMELSLLRSSQDPDPKPTEALIHFPMAITPILALLPLREWIELPPSLSSQYWYMEEPLPHQKQQVQALSIR